MRKIIIFCAMLVFGFAISQQEKLETLQLKLKFGVELKAYFPVTISDQYISEGYSQKIGSAFHLLLTAQKKFGIGISYAINNSNVSNHNLVGLFEQANFSSYLFYAFYKHYFLTKYAVSAKVGLGEVSIKHTGNEVNVFRLKYNQLAFGVQFQYFFKENFYALAYNDFIFLNGKDMLVNAQDKDYFTKSAYTHTGIGVGYEF